MKEIEILVKLHSSKTHALKKLSRYKNLGIQRTKDIYYFDPKRDQLKADR